MTGLFYNYMFYLRAENDDKDTTTHNFAGIYPKINIIS